MRVLRPFENLWMVASAAPMGLDAPQQNRVRREEAIAKPLAATVP